MRKHERIISEEILGANEAERETDYLIVSVYYSKGGHNAFSQDTEPRGYYLSVSPETRGTTERGSTYKKFGLFSGIKVLLSSALAFSPKRLAAIEVDPAMVANLRSRVMDKRAAHV